MASQNGKERLKPVFAAALLSEGTVSNAAKSVGIAERTAYRWLAEDEELKCLIDGTNEEILKTAIKAVKNAGIVAVRTLLTIMENEASPPAVRVSAAKSLLEGTFKAIELEELSNRLEEIELRITQYRG